MSDYFTFPKRGNSGTSKQPDTPGSSRSSSRNLELPRNYRSLGGSNDGLVSMYSGDSQYSMDTIPASMMLGNEPTSGSLSHLATIDGLDDKENKEIKLDEYILPKTDFRSPYHVNVPIPRKLPKNEGKTKIKEKIREKANSSDLDKENACETSSEFVNEYPTDILVDRFHKWKKILKSLIAYFREAAYSQERIARINYQLKNAVKFAFLTDLEEGTNKLVDPSVSKLSTKKPQPPPLAVQKVDTEYDPDVEHWQQAQQVTAEAVTSASSGFMKFGSGSVQDIQVILKKYHLSLGSQQYKISKEIVAYLIPKLTDLRKDLTVKIKEIKELNGDFKTNIDEHVKITNRLLNKYLASVQFLDEVCNSGNKQSEKLKAKHDPYLLKLQLDLQLKRQLLEENYLQEAFINLQSAAIQLEKIVYSKIQCALQNYSSLIDFEARLMIKNLCHELQQGILSRPPAVEWDNFVAHHPDCLINLKSNDPIPQPRKLSDIVYPYMKSSLAKCIRVGYLFKKTESSNNFIKGYFVLTTNYLHEFRSSDFYLNSKTTHPKNKSFNEYPDVSIINKNSTDTIDHSSNNGIQDLKLIKRRKGLSSSNLNPVTSMSLNDCFLKKSTSTTFILQGNANYHLSEEVAAMKSSVAPNLACSTRTLATNNSKHQRTPSSLSMAPVANFLKGSSRSKEQKKSQGNSFKTKNSNIDNKTGGEKNVEWTFKVFSTSSEPTPEELKPFNKWVQDIKSLTSFNSTLERSKFIEEKVLRSRSHNNTRNFQCSKNSTSVTPTDNFVNLSEKATPPYSVSTLDKRKRTNRPCYIDIPKSVNTSAGTTNSVHRSKVNTPSIDENGNLAVVGETKNNAPQIATNSAFKEPSLFPYPRHTKAGYYYGHSNDNLMPFSSQKMSPSEEVPQIAVSNHGAEAVASASSYSDGSHKSSRVSSIPSIGTQHKTSSPSPLPLQNLPGASPTCLPLDDYANGYFGIPLNCNSESTRGSELFAFENEPPLLEENRNQQFNHRRKSSVGFMPRNCDMRVELKKRRSNRSSDNDIS